MSSSSLHRVLQTWEFCNQCLVYHYVLYRQKCVIFGRGTVHCTWFGLTSPHQSSDEYLKHVRTIQASFGVWINPDNRVRTVALPSFLRPLWKPHLHKNPYRQKSGACCLPSNQIKNWCYYLAGVTLLIWKNASSYLKQIAWEVWCSSGFESCVHLGALPFLGRPWQFSSYFIKDCSLFGCSTLVRPAWILWLLLIWNLPNFLFVS